MIFTETELKLIKLGRKFLKEGTDSEVLEQMKLLTEFGLYLIELDKKYNKTKKKK